MKYGFAIGISKYDPEKEMAIIQAVQAAWNISKWKMSKREDADVMIGSGVEEFDEAMEPDCSEATAISVWEANDGPCVVEVCLKPVDAKHRQRTYREEEFYSLVESETD